MREAAQLLPPGPGHLSYGRHLHPAAGLQGPPLQHEAGVLSLPGLARPEVLPAGLRGANTAPGGPGTPHVAGVLPQYVADPPPIAAEEEEVVPLAHGVPLPVVGPADTAALLDVLPQHISLPLGRPSCRRQNQPT